MVRPKSNQELLKESVTSIKCFKCQGWGHNSYECGRTEDRKQSVTCYACRQSRHKSWECPNKQQNSGSAGAQNAPEVDKKVNVKAGGTPTKSINWLAVQVISKWVDGEVNCFKYIIAPDTGAEVTVVPGHHVYDSW